VIPLASLAGRTFAVLGLGKSGRAACRALLAAGRTVWAWDDDARTRAAAATAGIPIVDLAACDLAPAGALVLSPGIPHTCPAPHPIVERARAAGCDIIGDGELLACTHPEARVVGITGTNGKSTTTALIGHILAAAGAPCAVGGNLGTPVLELPPLAGDGVYVLEMSSYQLDLTPSLVFTVAVLLNITPDHLARHGGMDGYVAAKRRVFRGVGADLVSVIGVDDDICRGIAAELTEQGGRRVVAISAEQPVAGGVFVRNGIVFDAAYGDTGGGAVAVIDLAGAAALPGVHNAQNAAAAYAATRALGIAPADIGRAIATFPGLAHRQERIGVVNGVVFVNDSKATNADAAARALACYEAIYWIAGGRAKEGGLAGVEPYLGRVRHAFVIGEAADAFARTLEGTVPVSRVGTLDRAVAAAAERAAAERVPGAVVLLSPACASFDQFDNFEARGDAFRALVERLKR
jgi:UDP-N-acetylmuramoylalanine--D-glutamate ligase